MIPKCKKCEIVRVCHHIYLTQNEKMYFCNQCKFRIDKMGYNGIQDYLDNKRDVWKLIPYPWQDNMEKTLITNLVDISRF